jgi:Transposase DDE domain.
MDDSLISKITEYFPKRNKTCLKNILILSHCILLKETINLNKLSSIVGLVTGKGKTTKSSNYKRLIRIFDRYSFSSLWIELLNYVFLLLRLECSYLLLDGTSWKRGSKWYHYLTLCIVYQGVAIPIYWEDLNKQGTSNFKERKRLMKKAFSYFHLSDKILLADREYIGIDWFKYLIANDLNFVIRLKEKVYKSAINEAKGRKYDQIKSKVLRSKVHYKTIGKWFELEGMNLQFVALKNPKEDAKEPVVFLISNLDMTPKKIAQMYQIRWKIEHCFRHLKSNGFQLEQINLKSKSRCKLLMAIMVFTYVISIHEGLKTYHKVPIKKHKNGTSYKEVSLFRHGIQNLTLVATSFIKFCLFIFNEIVLAQGLYNSRFSINV